jgi:genome maintenance exonuclease 1
MNHVLKSIEIDGMGRFYQSANTGNWYPSVTTVTGFAKKDFWKEWRKNPENRKTSEAAMRRGTALHTMVEEYLNDGTEYKTTDEKAQALFDQLVPNLNKINKVIAQESQLCSDTLRMAGRFDCIGEYEGVLSVIDFKSAKSSRKEEWITNYFEQTAAYSYMWLENHGERIPQVVILISAEDGTTQVFKKKPEEYKESLGAAIKNYWANNNFKELQRTINEMVEKTAIGQ